MAKDHSHITLKLRQTIIFLKYYYNAWNSEIRKFILADGDTEILDDLNKMIEEFKKEFWHFRETNLLPQYKDFPIWDYMDFLPSPIFNVEIGLQIVNSNEIEKFEKLSSGEKQLIYNVSSILYHIRNITYIAEESIIGHFFLKTDASDCMPTAVEGTIHDRDKQVFILRQVNIFCHRKSLSGGKILCLTTVCQQDQILC